jgi:hypothetical protein
VGWRSGNHDFLNESTDFRRSIYVEAPDQVPPTISAAVASVAKTYTVLARVPLASQDCKGSGWRSLVDATGRPFRNQGDCVSDVATKGKHGANG